MKLSWSHKLFLKINEQVGRWPWLDWFMVFCAKWLIYGLIGGFVAWLYYRSQLPCTGFGCVLQFRHLIFFSAVFLFFPPFLLSYGIALFWKHKRPIKELPDIIELVKPLGTWKSFPSDHTIAVTLLASAYWWLFMLVGSLEIGLLATAFTLCGILVMAARVYVGVHYPRDIIGGLIIGIGWSLILFNLV